MEELELTPRQPGSRAGHHTGMSVNTSEKVPRMLDVFKSPRGYLPSPGPENHCSGTFLFESALTKQIVVLLTSVLILH